MNTISIAATNIFGATFLDWSIHYLSGNNRMYSGYNRTTDLSYRTTSHHQDVVSNPLSGSGNNAHKHIKNHPDDIDELISLRKKLNIKSNEYDFMTIIPSFPSHYSDSWETDAIGIWNDICTNDDKVVLLNISNSVQCLYIDKNVTRVSDVTSLDYDNVKRTLSNIPPTDIQKFGDINHIWDIREILALFRRPFENFNANLDFTLQHYQVNPVDLMTMFDETVRDLFSYLEMNIDESRFVKWCEIYSQWKKIHYDRLLWVTYFEKIVHYIINGYDMDIARFNLDLFRESSIQHVLIYKYGLNLKTWGLEVFPTNTKQLHLLLEDNTHNISNYSIPLS